MLEKTEPEVSARAIGQACRAGIRGSGWYLYQTLGEDIFEVRVDLLETPPADPDVAKVLVFLRQSV